MAKRQGIMLAHPAEPNRVAKLGDYCIVQPKLNGVRCVVVKDEGKNFHLASSSGAIKSYLGHIEEELKKLPLKLYDGELYVHGKSWEWINSRAARTKNKHPDIESLQYHIFDYMGTPLDMDSRAIGLNTIESIAEKLELKHVKVVPTYLSRTTDWGYYLDAFMDAGYEGVMLRHRYMKYEIKRSPGLLKFKPRKTDIYKILYLIQGTGWCHDRLGAFWVVDKHGNEFGVGTGPALTSQGRMEYWEARDYLPGRYLLVKHEELKTINDLPKCVVAVNVLTDAQVEEYIAANHEDLMWGNYDNP